MPTTRNERQLAAIKTVAAKIGDRLDLDASLRLWDGSRVPLGQAVRSPIEIRVADAGVIGSLVRWPTLDNVIRHYIAKGIDFSGGTLIDLAAGLATRERAAKLSGLEMLGFAAKLSPFFFAGDSHAANGQGFEGGVTGRRRKAEDNAAYIQFHYDLSNDFYALFLDPEMVYSCAYFTEWENDLATAQRDKLDMICRKLRLKPGDRFLDIGCGWGGLVCHAAQRYGVKAHGITLSQEQLAFGKEKAARLGLEGRVELRLEDYSATAGLFDKIASIGMYEHVGLANIPAYMKKMRSLLADDGLFLNHAISRRAKRPGWLPERMRPEQRALAKYIFPGGELDDIGHTLAAMERAGFEVHDVEGWRMHYARTTKLWCERLTAEKERAIRLVGEEKYRVWIAYLAGCSLSFSRGTARLFQSLASKTAKRPPPLPPTRSDLYG